MSAVLILVFAITIKAATQKGLGCVGLAQHECLAIDQCSWDFWNPSKCQDQCGVLTEEQCNTSVQCSYSDSICFVNSCHSQTDDVSCNDFVGCRWQNGTCFDDSCIVLQVTNEDACPSQYCIWSSKRNICYDKRCVDYPTQVTCLEISYCYWDRYRCLLNTTSVMYQY